MLGAKHRGEKLECSLSGAKHSSIVDAVEVYYAPETEFKSARPKGNGVVGELQP